eukprot:scaffold3023_cov175-Amphora_coffeaeformis.AAC.3
MSSPRSVKDFADRKHLSQALSDTSVCDWRLGKYDEETSNPQSEDDELERLMVLQSYNILETKQEPEFDELTREAKEMFDVPIAVVSIVDMGRQWFKSIQGLDAAETPRDCAFCAHVVQRKAEDGILEVKDATKDFRFAENPLVVGGPKIRYYAGAPLRSPEGKILGSFCIIDIVPHPKGLSCREKQRLVSFAEMAVYNMITRV